MESGFEFYRFPLPELVSCIYCGRAGDYLCIDVIRRRTVSPTKFALSSKSMINRRLLCMITVKRRLVWAQCNRSPLTGQSPAMSGLSYLTHHLRMASADQDFGGIIINLPAAKVRIDGAKY